MTPRDRFPTIPPRSGDRRGCTRRTPTTRRKHETIHITSVFVSSSSRAPSHRASRDIDHRLFPSSRPRARDPPHLTVVLVQPGVHGVHDVRTNRGQENFRQGARRAVAALDGDHGKRGRHGVGRARRGKAERETRRGLSGRCVGFPQYMGFGFTVYDNLGVCGMIQTLMYAHYVLQCAL